MVLGFVTLSKGIVTGSFKSYFSCLDEAKEERNMLNEENLSKKLGEIASLMTVLPK